MTLLEAAPAPLLEEMQKNLWGFTPQWDWEVFDFDGACYVTLTKYETTDSDPDGAVQASFSMQDVQKELLRRQLLEGASDGR